MSEQGEKDRILFHAGDFPALEGALRRELDALRAEDRLAPIIVLVPTNLLRRHLAAVGAERGIINIHFLTLLDLARELGEGPLAAAGRRPLPAPGGELIARAACRGKPDTYFAAIAARPGFQRALLATIADFKEAGHTVAELRDRLDKRPLRSHSARPKLLDLAALWAAYEGRLAELSLYDDADLMSTAAAAAEGDRWLAQARAVLVYGFYDFNELQRRLVAACTAGRPARAFMPYLPGSDAFRYATPTFEWFKSLGFAPTEEPEAPADAGLAAIQRGLFATTAAGADRRVEDEDEGRGRLRIVSAPDEVREVRAIIRAAVEAARKGEVPLPRVGVLLRQPATYAPLFAEECHAGALDAYHHSPPPLATSRAGRSLLMLLGLIGSELERPDVMDFLTYADLAVDSAPTADWDLASIQAGIVKGREAWHRRLAALCRSLKDEADMGDAGRGGPAHARLLAAAESLDALLARFFPALERDAFASRSWAELVGAVVALFRDFVRPSAEREAVAEAVAELATLDITGEAADAATLARLARELLEGRFAPRAPFGSRGPVVVDLLDGRGLPFDLVCVPGLVEGGFPAAPAVDPLLSDQERDLLGRAGLPLPLKGERGQEERLLFRLAVGAGAKKVLLTYPRLEPASDRERVPSHFLLRAVEAATGVRCDYKRLAAFVRPGRLSASAFALDDPQAAWREGEYDLAVVRRALASRDAAELAYLGHVAATFGPAWRAEARRWEEGRFTPYDGVLADPAALAALAERLGPFPWRTAASALEQYAQCPFQYFLSRVLGIEALEEPETVRRISGLDRGSVLHRILFRALRRARDERRLPLRPEHEALVLEAARQGFAEFEQRGLVGHPALWALERETLERDLRRFVEDEARDPSGYLPTHFEAVFGSRRGHDAEEELWREEGVDIPLGGPATLRITGRMDRIDLTPDGKRGRVIDYKSGKRPKGLGDNAFAGGTALQLPLYLKAAAALLPTATFEAALYRFVTAAGEYRSIQFTRDEIVNREADLTAILGTIAEGIRSGRFFAGLAAGPCEFCDFKSVCGTASAALSEMKASDPAVEPFLKMRAIE
ncbi:MAG: hypothetical protein FJ291_24540 [Planctomycetes bacterium]|nr:hypothetical protein [Planctomycetota bacterium]